MRRTPNHLITRGIRPPLPDHDGLPDKEVLENQPLKTRRNQIMPININTNSAAASASFHLAKNQSALQKSLTRLSSGSRIVQPVDDAGGLAVAMKM